VNTVSLRGLGPGRTLVLFNGKRLPPAGVRGQVGAVDLNTIPRIAVDRFEIVRDGASPIYGSEAIGGVINVLTRRNTDGLELTATGSVPFEGGGEQYLVGGVWGRTGDRFNIMLSGEYSRTEELNLSDRDYSRCVDDYVFNGATGERVDFIDPVTGKPKCYNGGFSRAQAPNGIAGGVLVQGNWVPDARATANTNGIRPDAIVQPNGTCLLPNNSIISAANCNVRLTVPGYRRLFSPRAGQTGVPLGAQLSYENPFYDRRDIISTAERYSLYGQGSIDLDVLGGIELFAEGFWNRRESRQENGSQLFFNIPATNIFNPFGVITQPVLPRPSDNSQTVDAWQIVGGVRGQTGGGLAGFLKDGQWELSAQYGKSDGDYDFVSILGDRIAATLATTRAANGSLSCPSPTISGGACVPINFFDPRVVNGDYTAEEYAYLFGAPNLGNTVYEQTVVDGNISGDLFRLPAGDVAANFGFQWRNYSINDVPGAETLRGNVILTTASGVTKGEDTVREVFGEIEIPILAKQPFAEELTVNIAGRWTEYDSYPANSTYKIAAQWAVTPAIRFRGSYGTNYKAPALFELFLGGQTAFLAQGSIDPCINWGTSGNQTIRTRCQAAGVPPEYTGAGTSSATIIQAGGLGVLRDETATSLTYGVVYRPEWADLQIALDYSKVENDDQVARFGGAAIVGACYGDNDAARAAQFCTLFTRNPSNAAQRPNEITTVRDSYVNIAKQNQSELSLNIDYRREFSFGTFAIASETVWQLKNEFGLFNATQLSQLVSDIGFPNVVTDTDFSFTRKDWRFTWTVNGVGKMSEEEDFLAANGANPLVPLPGSFFAFTGAPSIKYKTHAETTIYHAFSVRYRSDDWTLIAGVDNIFDEAPPAISTGIGFSRLGRGALTSQYDLRGRSVFATITRRF